LSFLTANEQTAVTAVFKKFCTSVGGDMVFGYDPRLAHRLTLAKTPTGADLQDYYPDDAIKREVEGTLMVMYVAEPDGRVSWPYLIRSSGDRVLDIAGVLWLKSISFKTPAYLDFMPVRLFMTMNLTFKLSPPTQRYQDHSRR
jgi:TonB family protein